MYTKKIILIFLIANVVISLKAKPMDSYDILRVLRPKLVLGTNQGEYGDNLFKYKKEIESLSPEKLANLVLLIHLTFRGISWSAEDSESLMMVLRGCKNREASRKILLNMDSSYLEAFFKMSKKDLDLIQNSLIDYTKILKVKGGTQ